MGPYLLILTFFKQINWAVKAMWLLLINLELQENILACHKNINGADREKAVHFML